MQACCLLATASCHELCTLQAFGITGHSVRRSHGRGACAQPGSEMKALVSSDSLCDTLRTTQWQAANGHPSEGSHVVSFEQKDLTRKLAADDHPMQYPTDRPFSGMPMVPA